MKKSLTSILSLVTISCLLITMLLTSTNTSTVIGNTILPDKNDIKAQKHMKKIEELTPNTVSKDEKTSIINNYLSTLGSKELLETSAEYIQYTINQEDTNDYLSVIAPRLEKTWQQGIPYGDVANILKDKTYNDNFRLFTADVATRTNGNIGQSNAELIDSIYSIAQDNNENTKLRRDVLLDLTKTGVYKSPGSTTEKSKLDDIFKDPNAPPEVKSAVITAMRRTQDPKFKETVIPILADLKSYPAITIRHAVVESSTDGISVGYVKELTDLANSTKDKEVYASTILSLGINGGVEAVKAIVSNYGRFNNPDICNHSLERNQKTIKEMLNLNQSSDIIQVGISAAKLVKVDSFISPLKQISVNIKDNHLNIEADQALKVIESDPIKSNPKWEEVSK